MKSDNMPTTAEIEAEFRKAFEVFRTTWMDEISFKAMKDELWRRQGKRMIKDTRAHIKEGGTLDGYIAMFKSFVSSKTPSMTFADDLVNQPHSNN